MKIKVTYIISNTNKALAFEWLATFINREKFELSFILLNPGGSSLEKFLSENGIKVTRVRYTGKRDFFRAFFQVYRLLRIEKPSIVHTHLFEASLIGLTAAKMAGIKSRVVTRHHSNSNHTYAPAAVKYDLFINRMSTRIVAVSNNVKGVLMREENVPSQKIRVIPHGLDMHEAENVSSERIKLLKTKYGIGTQQPVIGVISRYIHLKGIQYIIPAFKKLLEQYPSALLFLANARGSYSTEIKKLLAELPSSSYAEVGFEEDLFALYGLFDIYIHVPVDSKCEAFGQTYLEALACKVPSVFTLSGVANDFIVNGQNALVADYMNSESIFEKMIVLLRDPSLSRQLTEKGLKDVKEKFNITTTVLEHEQLYLNL